MAYLQESMLVFGGIVNDIHGSAREVEYAADTWTIKNGCPAGYFGRDQKGCQKCSDGHYSSDNELSNCIQCPENTTSHTTGATQLDSCNACKKEVLGYGVCQVVSIVDALTKKLSTEWTCFSYSWGSRCQHLCPGLVHTWDHNKKYYACNKHGQCKSNGKCACDEGYAGEACEIYCLPHGASDGRTCKCDPDFFGLSCSNLDNVLQLSSDGATPRNKSVFTRLDMTDVKSIQDHFKGFEKKDGTCKNYNMCNQRCANGQVSNTSCLLHNDSKYPHKCGCDCAYNNGKPSKFFGPLCNYTCLHGGVAHIVSNTVGGNNTLKGCQGCSFFYTGHYCEFPIGWFYIFFVFFFFSSLVFILYKYYKRKVRKEKKISEMRQEILRREWQQDLSMVSDGWKIDDIDLKWEKKLAEGAFGAVWRGVWDRFPGSYVAIKIIKFIPGTNSVNDSNFGDPGVGLEGKVDVKKKKKKEIKDEKDEKERCASSMTRSSMHVFHVLGEEEEKEEQEEEQEEQEGEEEFPKKRHRTSKSEGDGTSRLGGEQFQFGETKKDKNVTAAGVSATSGGSGDSSEDWVDKEISVLMRTRHPRVVLFLGGGRLRLTGEVFLVSEFMQGGDLHQALAKRDKLTGKATMKWSHRLQSAYDIAEGMQFLHSKNLIHRDLKSLNCLIDGRGRTKIADFGLSKFTTVAHAYARKSFAGNATRKLNVNSTSLLSENEDDNEDPLEMMIRERAMNEQELEMTGLMGSVNWMAPELFTKTFGMKATYGLAADVYSFGVVLFELVTSRMPWSNVRFQNQVIKKVENSERPNVFQEEEQEATNNDATTLVELMHLSWAQKPENRPTFSELVRRLKKVECVSITMELERQRSVTGGYRPPQPTSPFFGRSNVSNTEGTKGDDHCNLLSTKKGSKKSKEMDKKDDEKFDVNTTQSLHSHLQGEEKSRSEPRKRSSFSVASAASNDDLYQGSLHVD